MKKLILFFILLMIPSVLGFQQNFTKGDVTTYFTATNSSGTMNIKAYQVSAASIYLNNNQFLYPNNFNGSYKEFDFKVNLTNNNSLRVDINNHNGKMTITIKEIVSNTTSKDYKIINLEVNESAETEDGRDMTVPSYNGKHTAKVKKNGKPVAKVKVNFNKSDADFEDVIIENGEEKGVGYAVIHVDNKSKVIEEKQLYVPIIKDSNTLCLLSGETNLSLITPDSCSGQTIINPQRELGNYLINVTGSLVFEFWAGYTGGGSYNVPDNGGGGGGSGGGISVEIGTNLKQKALPKDFTNYLWLLAIILLYLYGEKRRI